MNHLVLPPRRLNIPLAFLDPLCNASLTYQYMPMSANGEVQSPHVWILELLNERRAVKDFQGRSISLKTDKPESADAKTLGSMTRFGITAQVDLTINAITPPISVCHK